MSRVFATACALTALPAVVQAQAAATITGRVTSDNGQPLVAASVFIPTLNLGTTTREDGTYSFSVPGARVSGQSVGLSVRRVGYRSETVQITLRGGTITQNFTLQTNALQLGQVVVTGAGTTTTAERLGAVRTQVDTAALVNAAEPNVAQALAAKAPGVVVSQQSGDPGASSKIVIRGLNTIQGTGNPLFVVDGTPINNQTLYTNGTVGSTVSTNRAYDLNPEDIESVEVLKSAAAAAIYGARASQGVILITTKKGRAGQTHYSLRSTATTDDVSRTPPLQQKYDQGSRGVTQNWLTNTKPGSSLPSGSFGALITSGEPVVDQATAMFERGTTFDNDLQVSGGNDRTTFFLSGGWSDQNGIIVGDKDTYLRQTVRLNASHRLTSAFQASANVSYVDARGSYVQRGSNTSGITLGGWRSPATYDNRRYIDSASGQHASYRLPRPTSINQSRGYDNPFFVINAQDNTSQVGRTLGNIALAYTPASWLNVNYTLGADYTNDERLEAVPKTSSNFPAGQVIRPNFVTYIIDQLLNAQTTRTWSDGWETRLGVGAEFNSQRFVSKRATGNNLVADLPFNLQNTITVTGTETRQLIRRESYFAQIQQTLWNDLFATVTVRNDGFSTFGENNRRNWFPSAQLSYLFTNKLNFGGFLSDGKLRFALGQTGSEPGVYLTNATYLGGYYGVGGWGDQLFSVQNGQGGLITGGRVAQPNLKPERQTETEGGFDLAFLHNHADLSFTIYTRIARDVIFDLPLPASSGYSVQARNAAQISNRGIELSFNLRPVQTRNTDVTLGFQFARNRNNVDALEGANSVDLPTGGYFSGTLVSAVPGHPLGSFRSYDFARCRYGETGNVVNGVDVNAVCKAANAPEGAMYIGADGFPLQDQQLRVVGDPNPRWTGAFRPSVRYRGVTFAGLFDVRHGGQVWNGTKGALYNFGTHEDTQDRASCPAGTQASCTGNLHAFGVDFQPGRSLADAKPFAIVGPGANKQVSIGEPWFVGLGSGFGPVASQFMEDGSFVKLREISVAFTFAQAAVRRAIGMSSIDVRLAGRNLALWTKYTGVDPETNLAGAGVGAQGVDYFNNPFTRSLVLTVGLNR